ncbi:uncharacterized LOC118063619 [Chelonus insularis]|uniref:uncharacterized LOC118063619 n=1 Tax=Chelonus insularis TaxID=460826 RepID=UPI00158ECEE7|nr:uncharacterized LOC118063619 [Chelonus insularis]KAG8148370.1 DhNVorf67-like protein [Chelonus insularis]
MQDELVLDYEAEQATAISVDEEEDDNVTVTINNSAQINYPTVAYVYNKEDNTYNVTNSELELKSRIDMSRLNKQLESCHTDSHLRQYYEIKQHYFFLQNVPLTQRINVPIFTDRVTDTVTRVLVIPYIVQKPSIHEVIYNLVNGPWLAKPKQNVFKISADYINKYMDQVNTNELWKTSKHLKLDSKHIGILATSYFKVGKAKCLASITVGFFQIENQIKLLDFVTVNHSNVKNFQHNEDQLREMIKKYDVEKIFCWLPNYGTIYNALFGNVYWFNKVLVNSDGRNRLYNLFGKMSMEKNLDTKSICVNSIEHSEFCSFCNMIRLGIKLFNVNEHQIPLNLTDNQDTDHEIGFRNKRNNVINSSNTLGKQSTHFNHGCHKLNSRGMRTSKMLNANNSCHINSLGGFRTKQNRCNHKECLLQGQNKLADKKDDFFGPLFSHNHHYRHHAQRNRHHCH